MGLCLPLRPNLARELEAYVHREIQAKNFSTSFATAAEVARNRQGDCTEHAVLLTALCRARGIPARIAFGLVYFVDPERATPGFAYHMWTEVYVRQRWVPLDATLGRGGIGAAHLKLSDSHLAGMSPFAAFLPLAQVVNRLEIEVLEVNN